MEGLYASGGRYGRFLEKRGRLSLRRSWTGPVLLLGAGACGVGGGSGFGSGCGASTGDGGGSADNPGLLGAGGVIEVPADPQQCTRESLQQAIDGFYEALAAHDPSMLPLAPTAKYTENGREVPVGQGLWQTADALKFKASALDAMTCNSATQSVITEGATDIPLGLRLKLQNQQITEIEAIAVRSGDYFVPSNTEAMINVGTENWEEPLAPERRATREALLKVVDDYFVRFPTGGCNFASDCNRMENGFTLACSAGISCSPSGDAWGSMTPRVRVIDVERGIGVGFVMFAGAYSDFHMFRVYDGQVHAVHAILASASESGW